jgi:4-hydroxy-tetrahydrodipicolinate reductase
MPHMADASIRVLVSGTGRMGRTIIDALDATDDMLPVGAVDALTASSTLTTASGMALAVYSDPATAIEATEPQVIVDFTNAAWTPLLADAALARGVRLVIGTTGLSEEWVEGLRQRCQEAGIGAVIAANFAIGAVLMMHMAKLAAPFFDAAEIIELHHDKKVDAPSGTSLATARAMLAARGGKPFAHNDPDAEPVPGGRGAELGGIGLHSIRLPGLVAHQEVIFGGLGQTLSIRHDTTGRDSFMPGVLLAAREVMRRRELVVGLEALIGLAA